MEVAESVIPSPVCTFDNDNVTSQPQLSPPKKRLAAVLVHVLSTPSEELSGKERVKRETRGYDNSVVDMEVDPLSWWKNEEGNHPYLAALAKKLDYVKKIQF